MCLLFVILDNNIDSGNNEEYLSLLYILNYINSSSNTGGEEENIDSISKIEFNSQKKQILSDKNTTSMAKNLNASKSNHRNIKSDTEVIKSLLIISIYLK